MWFEFFLIFLMIGSTIGFLQNEIPDYGSVAVELFDQAVIAVGPSKGMFVNPTWYLFELFAFIENNLGSEWPVYYSLMEGYEFISFGHFEPKVLGQRVRKTTVKFAKHIFMRPDIVEIMFHALSESHERNTVWNAYTVAIQGKCFLAMVELVHSQISPEKRKFLRADMWLQELAMFVDEAMGDINIYWFISERNPENNHVSFLPDHPLGYTMEYASARVVKHMDFDGVIFNVTFTEIAPTIVATWFTDLASWIMKGRPAQLPSALYASRKSNYQANNTITLHKAVKGIRTELVLGKNSDFDALTTTEMKEVAVLAFLDKGVAVGNQMMNAYMKGAMIACQGKSLNENNMYFKTPIDIVDGSQTKSVYMSFPSTLQNAALHWGHYKAWRSMMKASMQANVKEGYEAVGSMVSVLVAAGYDPTKKITLGKGSIEQGYFMYPGAYCDNFLSDPEGILCRQDHNSVTATMADFKIKNTKVPGAKATTKPKLIGSTDLDGLVFFKK